MTEEQGFSSSRKESTIDPLVRLLPAKIGSPSGRGIPAGLVKPGFFDAELSRVLLLET